MKISTQKTAQTGHKISTLSKVGIFSLSTLAAASAVYLYSPTFGSHADSNLTSRLDAVISPVASITLSTDNLSFDITPSSSGTFESKSVTATVSTNSTGGYELYFSSIDNDTAMVSNNEDVTDTIASDFNGTVTSSTMAKNKWGYSLDDTDFSKIPSLSNQATIKNIDHYPQDNERATTVYIGTKIADDLEAGTYSKTVKLSVLAHETPVPREPAPAMQEFDKTSLVNTHDSTILRDIRDNDEYTVKKLKDGNVWMTQNLRLGKNEAMTLTPTDSDVASNFEIPASNEANFTSTINTKAVYIDSTYGGYYNFYTASAGEGGESKTSGDVEHSICPKGWRLPTQTEFQTLYNTHYKSSALMQGEPGFVLSGSVSNGSVDYQGSDGYYWPSTVYDDNYANYLYLTRSAVYPTWFNGKSSGYSVRCIAR